LGTIFIAICFINFIIALLYLFDFAIAAQTKGFLTQRICCCNQNIWGLAKIWGPVPPGLNVKLPLHSILLMIYNI